MTKDNIESDSSLEQIREHINSFFVISEDHTRAEKMKKYFKSPFIVCGIKKSILDRFARSLRKPILGLNESDFRALISNCWMSEKHEEKTLAIVICAQSLRRLRPEDVKKYFSHWLDECRTWDHVDELCITVVGVLCHNSQQLWKDIEPWKNSSVLWKRRASLISHLPGIRKKRPAIAELERSISALADDTDFFIRKAIGWVLREVGDKNIEDLHSLLLRVGSTISPLSLREALRKVDKKKQMAIKAQIK